jgi:hypothetical protein
VRHAAANVFPLIPSSHGLPLALARGGERCDESAVDRERRELRRGDIGIAATSANDVFVLRGA